MNDLDYYCYLRTLDAEPLEAHVVLRDVAWMVVVTIMLLGIGVAVIWVTSSSRFWC
ncbi:MAG TPA: hypothetical protein VGC42_01755 [Kofleriaceae bacterium]